MKYFRYFFLFIFLLPTLYSCKEDPVSSTEISVLIDVTDKRFEDQNFIAENLPKFLKMMNLNKETGGYSGGEIKLSLINEVSDSKSKIVKISSAKTGLMGENKLTRKDEVNRFYTNIEKSFSQLLNEANWGTNASKIYQKIARELIKMKSSDYDKKVMVIYSDMLENSNLFSFYSTNWKTDVQKMTENPETTLDKLSQAGPALPDLSEFEIYVIASRTAENDEKVNLSEHLWKALFEYQGANVVFNSGLEI